MEYEELAGILQNIGRDPSRLIFEDELTGIHNRRFFHGYLDHKVAWTGERDFPLALLLIDLDHFKRINDTHGHAAGDQALTWFAGLLKEVAGANGIPIRYAGDEFAVLLPKTRPIEARECAERLLSRTTERPFRLRGSGVAVPVTVSIGIATAPDDAQEPDEFIHKADTALYYAKQSGRNRTASAREADPTRVFGKIVLRQLKAGSLVGREEVLTVVQEALEDLTARQSHFVVVEGAPGMGKTAVLETLRSTLAGDPGLRLVEARGVPQEDYRPFHVAAQLLEGLLDQREDRGASILQELSEAETAYLGELLPQLRAEENGASSTEDGPRREGLFNVLLRLIGRLAEPLPLVAMIDDLHAADGATLHLVRVLLQRKEVPLLLCATAAETLQLGDGAEESPFERMEELDIRRVKLLPLTGDDVAEHLRLTFPGLSLPVGLEEDLAGLTQGNPLFLSEIVRKLVRDHKVTLSDSGWSIAPLEEGYLPHSLEEIVQQKIAALDEESQQILAQASTFGENLSLSYLAGSSELNEGRILEFLDRAEALGLMRLDFKLNDETVRFLGKRILEVAYGGIQPERRQQLHEKVGAYQEQLFQQRLLPSASLLAYHFRRSANHEKTAQYEQLQHFHDQRVFDFTEAARYTGEPSDEEGRGDEPLTAEALGLVPRVLRMVLSAVRSIQLYPPKSRPIALAQQRVREVLEQIHRDNDRLSLSQSQNVLLANGQRLDVGEHRALALSFVELLSRAALQGMTFRQGLGEAELATFLRTLGSLRPQEITPRFWRQFLVEQDVEHIELRQLHYEELRRAPAAASRLAGQERPEQERPLAEPDLAEVPGVLRSLTGAVRNIRLYPLGSQPVERSIEQLHEALQAVLSHQPSLTLAGIHGSLLVNGARVSTQEFETLANGFLAFLGSVDLMSVTFWARVTRAELETFIGTLRELPSGVDRSFWNELAREKGLSGLAFNRLQYGLGVVESLLASPEGETLPEEAGGSSQAQAEALVEGSREELREALPRFGAELIARGDLTVLWQLLRRLFEDFGAQDPTEREGTVSALRELHDGLVVTHRHQLAELGFDHLLGALASEGEPRVLTQIAVVLHLMASAAVQFSDYQLAERILLALRSRQRALQQAEQGRAAPAAEVFDRELEPAAAQLLTDDIHSRDAARRERAASVLGNLGPSAAPILVEVIKQEPDYRARQMAAGLLARMGPIAARQIKRDLALEVTAEQRFRLLEVVDTVTQDLHEEIVLCLGDANAKVRRAAFRLADRLRDERLIEVLEGFARKRDSAPAKGAIRCIAMLRSEAAASALASVLSATRQAEVAIACCQGLGQIGTPTAVAALARVLGDRRLLILGRRWDEQVRAAAALALLHMEDPRAKQTLERFAKDRDLRVRRIAGSPSGSTPKPRPDEVGEAEREDEERGPSAEESAEG